MPRFATPLTVISIAATLALAPHSAAAQLPVPHIGLMGGVTNYDLSGGSGTTPIGALRVDIPIVVAVAEGSLAVFRPNENGVHRTYLIPEAQLQWQLLPTLVKPYIGVGGGWFKAVSGPSPQQNDVTISAAGGVRIGVPLTGIGFRGEVRVRGIGSGFHDRATEFTIGVSW
jgi:hypothetical protein